MTTAFSDPNDDVLRALLTRVRTIAVVGLSPNPSRASNGVAKHLQRFGYRVVPVRPAVESVLGEKAYADLADIPFTVDLVDVFRAPEYVDAIVDRCIERGIRALWLQLGVVNEPAVQRARAAGMTVVMDRCLYQEYLRLFGPVTIDRLSPTND